jgi:branched-chain amino acid transport system permease protein
MNDFVIGIFTLIGIYMITVLGLSLLTGFTGLFSFGHAGFMAIGAYTAAALSTNMFIDGGIPFPLAIIAAGTTAAVIGCLLGLLTLNLKGDYFCIATLGFGEATRLTLDNLPWFYGARGWSGIPRRPETLFYEVIIIVIIATIVIRCIVVSRQGKHMIAVREEELAAQMIGVNTFKAKLTSLVTSAFYAGVAGGLFAIYMGFINPRMFSMQRSVELTIMVIFGGLGSIGGSLVGTLVLGSLPFILQDLREWRFVIYGAIVVFIVIVRPEGLMGGREFFGERGIIKLNRFRRGEKSGA